MTAPEDDEGPRGHPAGGPVPERDRRAEGRGEETLQLLFTAHQDLQELADAGAAGEAGSDADAHLISARACVAAALTLVQDGLVALRSAAAEPLAPPPPATPSTTTWSLSDSWLVVGADTKVLAISDDACVGLGVSRADAVGAGLSEVTGVVPDRVLFRVREAAELGLSTTETPVVVGGVSRMLRIVIQRLPGTAFGRGAFVVLVGPVPDDD